MPFKEYTMTNKYSGGTSSCSGNPKKCFKDAFYYSLTTSFSVMNT